MVKTIVNIITVILLFSTTICGLYLHYAKDKIGDYSGAVNFHLGIALATVAIVLVNVFVVKKG